MKLNEVYSSIDNRIWWIFHSEMDQHYIINTLLMEINESALY